MRKLAIATIVTVLTANASALHAADVVAAPLKVGDVYSVESTETLRGHIDFKAPGGNDVKKLKYNGERKSRYLERILAAKFADDAIPERVLRVIEKLESWRKIGDHETEKGFPLRDESRHVVLHRGEAFSKPFSLKGPLKQDEIHTLSHQVFVPALNGLLPTEPLKVGLKWNANKGAVAQLAGLVPMESGNLSCTVNRLDFPHGDLTLVQIGFEGVLKGMSEEGRVSDDVTGSMYLDRSNGRIHSLTVEGVRTLFDEKETTKVVGSLEMKYTLAIRERAADANLGDAIAAEAAKDPTLVQTAVLYAYPPCAVEIVHPRAWILHDATKPPRLEFMYGKEGHQLTMNFHEDDKTPNVNEYFKEVEGSLNREKFTDVKWTIEPEQSIDGQRGNANFRCIGRFEATAKKDGDWRMRYYVWQKGRRGVSVGVFTHSQAASRGTLVEDAWVFLKGLTFTGDRNPFFVKPKEPAKK